MNKVAIGLGHKPSDELVKKLEKAADLAGEIHRSNVELDAALSHITEAAIMCLEKRSKKELELIILTAIMLGVMKACVNTPEILNDKGETPNVTH